MPYGVPPLFGCIGSLEFASRLLPACGNSVSGDALFQETARSDGRVQFLLLDVCGKGCSAAAVVAAIKRQLELDEALSNRGPADLLTILHSRLAPIWAEAGRFVCAMAVLVDGGERQVEVANAGLPHPVRWQNHRVETLEVPRGFPLGIPEELLSSCTVEDGGHKSENFCLQERENLLFVSDGVTETVHSGNGQLLGSNGLETLWRSAAAEPSIQRQLTFALERLRALAAADWPHDDTTIFAVGCPKSPTFRGIA